MKMRIAGPVVTTLLLCSGTVAGQAESPGDEPASPAPVVRGCCAVGAPPILEAVPAGEELSVDGRTDEPAWRAAPVAAGFVQFMPDEGDPATERTEARVLYGTDALYVAIRAFDSDPRAITGQLTRRDQDSHSDLVGVIIDSYFDKRTAFEFAVNPLGVKHDVYRFDDTQEDAGWDAVWDVATSRDEEGWTAEFRIPYSQLRFRDADVQTWGINFTRTVARRQERSMWAPTTRGEAAVVSRLGELRGLENLQAPSRIEVLPYSLARLDRSPGDAADPYYERNATSGTFGADVKYGVSSDLTLDVTLNPDFGQVEADPAQVNLTAFETFLPERRPFFLEGASIFNFGIALGDGDEANESLFYSRRIGRAPQGRVDPGGGWVDADDQTTIVGAMKLSGKTASGWSIGALHAVTAEERAHVSPVAGGPFDAAIEPLTNYSVMRLQKDFREGRSALGLIGTAVLRDGVAADLLGLRSRAFAGGVDVRHRFAGDRWQVSGYVLGSHVRGSEAAIARTQRSPVHYFQRPDAQHVAYDPTRTSMSGASANFGVSKFAGGPWRVGTGFQTRTPGFEVNDLGFQNTADYFTQWFWAGYHQTAARGWFRSWFVNLNGWGSWTLDGDRVSRGGNVNANFQLRNFWNGYLGVNRQGSALTGGLLRGGPLFLREAQTNFWGGFGTDARRSVHLSLNAFGNVRPESDSWSLGLSPTIRVRPSSRATLSVGSFVNRNLNDRQWVARLDGESPAYLFGRLNQRTVGVTTRLDYAFTPTLSLQLYAQPFVSAGDYEGFKRARAPRAERYADRFQAVEPTLVGDHYEIDVDGDGEPERFSNPDFNVKQFRSNAVLRWEYRPGSALFLVWSNGRDHASRDGTFDFAGDLGRLFEAEASNVFMVKLSYWFSR